MLFRRRAKQLAIANPCRESWNAMAGSNAQRFCSVYNLSVHNLSALTRREAAELFDNNAGGLCGRISYDERGKQTFAKERRPIERIVQISVLVASVVASAAAAPTCDVRVRVVDAVGAVIPKATIKMSNADAELVSSGMSDLEGEFSDRIAAGIYSLHVESAGFMSYQQELACKTSENVSVDAPLQVGQTFGGVIVEVRSKPFPVLGKLLSLFRRH